MHPSYLCASAMVHFQTQLQSILNSVNPMPQVQLNYVSISFCIPLHAQHDFSWRPRLLCFLVGQWELMSWIQEPKWVMEKSHTQYSHSVQESQCKEDHMKQFLETSDTSRKISGSWQVWELAKSPMFQRFHLLRTSRHVVTWPQMTWSRNGGKQRYQSKI